MYVKSRNMERKKNMKKMFEYRRYKIWYHKYKNIKSRCI